MVKKSINEKISKKSKVSKEKIISSDDETEYTLSDLDINLTPLRIQPQQELKTLENTQSVQPSTCLCKLPRDDPRDFSLDCGKGAPVSNPCDICKGCNKDEDIFHISLSKIKSLKELLTDELANEKSNQMIVDSLVDKISEMIKNIE